MAEIKCPTCQYVYCEPCVSCGTYATATVATDNTLEAQANAGVTASADAPATDVPTPPQADAAPDSTDAAPGVPADSADTAAPSNQNDQGTEGTN